MRPKDNGTEPIGVPIKLVLESISEATVTPANHDGMMPSGEPVWDFTGQVSGPTLDPGESTAMRPLVFENPLLRPFTLSASVVSEAVPEPTSVTLSLTTDGNHSVIMQAEVPPVSGVPRGVGEELSVRISGRGFDYEFRRAYRGFSTRRALGHKDFGENWTHSYADEFLVKDGAGSDNDANYVFFRDGQAAYML